MKLNETVSLRVKKLLEEQGITQYQLFIRSGVPQPTISALIRCLHPKQMLLTIYQLCQGFGIGLTEFFNSPLFDNKNITDE